jgi:hypothetical protein
MKRDDSTLESRLLWAGLAVLLLLLLGMFLPFWMEYKSLSAPVRTHPVRGSRVPTLDSRKKYYCPACGATLSLPQWDDMAVPGGRHADVKLKSLAPSAWELPLLSTGLSRSVPQTILDKGGSP